jgi:WS/DGAT/MGAT family acyltransferase
MEQHIFYHRSRKVIAWEDVRDQVARLHEPVMDRSRPLWGYHLVDNIRDRRFAVYFKVHHAYADGITMTRWLDSSFSGSPEDMQLRPVWTRVPREAAEEVSPRPTPFGSMQRLTGQAWQQAMTTGGMAKLAAQQLLERAGVTRKAVSLQFNTGHTTPLTGSASPGRSIATVFMPMDDVRRVCRATRCTLNHVALTCIDAAMRRYLEEIGFAPGEALTIQMPVNLRKDGDDDSGNRVGVALVELGRPDADLVQRLHDVGHSLHNVKNLIAGVPGHAMQQYTVISALATELIGKLKLSDWVPATGHTLVSNVPGPRRTLYLQGARAEQMYPISILVPGLRMNVTLFSCSGVLNIGIVATRDLPRLQRLADLIGDSFRQLASEVGAA